LLVSSLLHEALPGGTLVVAIDPGKVESRVWLTSGERGLIRDPLSLPTLREGVDELVRLVAGSSDPLIAIEATGSLHRAWTVELERRFPGRVRLFAPSETQAARAQLGSRRFKSDDRDCAALVWLARQGLGRAPAEAALQALLGAVRHRRQLVAELKVLRQRLHDQLNALCPGLSAPRGHGRALDLLRPSGRAVLACAAAFAGRAPSVRSLLARAPGRLTRRNAEYWAGRWRACLGPPADADLRAARLSFDLERLDALLVALAATDTQLAALLAETEGQVLTSLPGVAVIRAAAFAAHSLPIERFASADQLYSATGLAPASYESASISRRGRISRQGLAEHRDALMAIAWGLSQASPAFHERAREYASRGFAPMQVRVALARHACRLCHTLLRSQEPYEEARYSQARRKARAVTAPVAMPHDGAT
jgi:transposase